MLRICCFFAILSFALVVFGYPACELQAKPGEEQLRKIKTLLSSYGQRASFSLRSPEGEVLLEVNADKPFTPASVAKLVSSACTLDALGSNFQFETWWGYRGELSKGVLKGDLIVRGAGDFSFVIEDLKLLVERLYHVHAIKKIDGRLVFDTSYLEEPRMRIYEGFEKDRGRAFNAMITAAPINHNAFAVWVVPESPKPRVEILPVGADELKVENRLKLGPGRYRGSRTNLNYLPEENRLVMSGQIGNRDQPRAYYRALADPYESFARLFKKSFLDIGGSWEGGVRIERAQDPGFKYITQTSSRSISRLLIDINKLSTNFGSEMALLAAASKRISKQTGAEAGRKLLEKCVSEKGFSKEDINLANASGLARDSKLKASALSGFLYKMSNEEFFPEYLASLSILGRDGTTASRLKGFRGKARLKTGTIRGVDTLAGYVGASPRKMMPFALMLNCNSCDLRKWGRLEDQILEILASEG